MVENTEQLRRQQNPRDSQERGETPTVGLKDKIEGDLDK